MFLLYMQSSLSALCSSFRGNWGGGTSLLGKEYLKKFTVLIVCSIVQYRTAGVGIVKIFVQFLLLFVLYLIVLQELKLFNYVYSSSSFSLLATEPRLNFNCKYQFFQSGLYQFVIIMQIYFFIYKIDGLCNMYGKVTFDIQN